MLRMSHLISYLRFAMPLLLQDLVHFSLSSAVRIQHANTRYTNNLDGVISQATPKVKNLACGKLDK